MHESYEVVICGAGIAGISTAYFLAVHYGVPNVLLIDERPPLSLTSDKSTEAYRNFWPGPDDAMIGLLNRSIDLMEQLARATDNRFLLNRRGYVYATARADVADRLIEAAEQGERLGVGPLRVHTSARTYTPSPPEGFAGVPTGIDVLVGSSLVREVFPYLNPTTTHVVHVRRAGWLSAQQLGMLMLEEARARGVRLMKGKVLDVEQVAGRVAGVRVSTSEGEHVVRAGAFVNTAGPFVGDVAQRLGVTLPVFCEPHAKWMFNDYKGVIPRAAPMVIWADPQRLAWTDEEREALLSDPELHGLLEEFPPGVHLRPEGGGGSTMALLLWAYHARPSAPTFPVEFDPLFPDIVLRGATTLMPGLRVYWERAPKPVIDGGYYTKTPENLPLVGPLPVGGAYVVGALGGFGIMAACGVGELAAAHVAGAALPAYAPAFLPARYDDPGVYPNLSAWTDTWQL